MAQEQAKALEKTTATLPESDYLEATPPVDIYENDQEVLLLADMPGVRADDTSIRLEPPRLVIEGRASRREGLRPLRYERAFRVGDNIDAVSVSAELQGGVLAVHLKKSEAAKPRKIQVKGGK